MSEPLQQALGGVGEVFSGIFSAASGLLPALGGVVDALGVGLAGVVETVAPLLADMASSIVALLQDAMPVLEAFVGALAEGLGSAFEGLLPVVTEVVGLLGTLLVGAFEALTPILPTIGELIGSIGAVLADMVSMLNPVADALTTVLGGALEAAIPALDGMMSALQALVDSQAFTLLGNAVADLVVAFGPLLNEMIPVLIEALTPMIPALGSFVKVMADILNLITPMIEGIGGLGGVMEVALLPLTAYTKGLEILWGGAEKMLAPLMSLTGANDRANESFRNSNVEDYAQRLAETGDAAETVKSRLDEIGLIVTRKGEQFDFTDQMEKLGLSTEEATALIMDGQGAIDDWGANAEAAGKGGDDLTRVLEGLRHSLEDVTAAEEQVRFSNIISEMERLENLQANRGDLFKEFRATLREMDELSEQIDFDAFSNQIKSYDNGITDAKKSANDLVEATEEMNAGFKLWGTTLDESNEFGRANIDVLDEMSDLYKDKMVAAIEENGASYETLKGVQEEFFQSIRDGNPDIEYTEQQLQELAAAANMSDADIQIIADAASVEAATEKLAILQGLLSDSLTEEQKFFIAAQYAEGQAPEDILQSMHNVIAGEPISAGVEIPDAYLVGAEARGAIDESFLNSINGDITLESNADEVRTYVQTEVFGTPIEAKIALSLTQTAQSLRNSINFGSRGRPFLADAWRRAAGP